jgi:hypothetical protein
MISSVLSLPFLGFFLFLVPTHLVASLHCVIRGEFARDSDGEGCALGIRRVAHSS